MSLFLTSHSDSFVTKPLQAMRELAEDIKAAKLKIFVRRGGPQVQMFSGFRPCTLCMRFLHVS